MTSSRFSNILATMVQAACSAVLTPPDGRRHPGRAMLEQLILGESHPYGFRDLFDMAP